MSQKPAAFQLDHYFFNKVNINLEKRSHPVEIDFNSSGIFYSEDATYELQLAFTAYGEEHGIDNPFVFIQCVANFKFEEANTLDQLPGYFYRNAIAIVFPYLRAFISMVTLQANIPPVILPTLNLSDLEGPLKANTQIK